MHVAIIGLEIIIRIPANAKSSLVDDRWIPTLRDSGTVLLGNS